MNKDVLISIKGLHFDNSPDGDQLEVLQPGQYYQRNGSHYLVYEEPVEGSADIIKNMLKFDDNNLSVNRKGSINTTMIFNTEEKNYSNYMTPFGSLTLGVDTHNIKLDIKNDSIRLDVDYSLDVNYEFLTRSHIAILITEQMQ